MIQSRIRGAILGLAAGDALGTTLEFESPGDFTPITDMIGGGPFRLQPGEWTDDTSMALCLAESLLATGKNDPNDQMQRYVRWWRDGYRSSNGRCFDIGNTVRGALERFERTGDPIQGSTDPNMLANGSLMRLAPVPCIYWRDQRVAARESAESSRTTHGAPLVLDACRYFGALIAGAVGGASKSELLHEDYGKSLWESPLHPEILEIAQGSFKRKSPPEIRGTGKVTHSLEAALWALHHGNDFREGALLAVNLGDDADTTGAIYGQIAGALYGEDGIPGEWRARLAQPLILNDIAERLAKAANAKAPLA